MLGDVGSRGAIEKWPQWPSFLIVDKYVSPMYERATVKKTVARYFDVDNMHRLLTQIWDKFILSKADAVPEPPLEPDMKAFQKQMVCLLLLRVPALNRPSLPDSATGCVTLLCSHCVSLHPRDTDTVHSEMAPAMFVSAQRPLPQPQARSSGRERRYPPGSHAMGAGGVESSALRESEFNIAIGFSMSNTGWSFSVSAQPAAGRPIYSPSVSEIPISIVRTANDTSGAASQAWSSFGGDVQGASRSTLQPARTRKLDTPSQELNPPGRFTTLTSFTRFDTPSIIFSLRLSESKSQEGVVTRGYVSPTPSNARVIPSTFAFETSETGNQVDSTAGLAASTAVEKLNSLRPPEPWTASVPPAPKPKFSPGQQMSLVQSSAPSFSEKFTIPATVSKVILSPCT
ncbi:hypothetical protein HRG_013015 [Hirsutella rhossiliensis]